MAGSARFSKGRVALLPRRIVALNKDLQQKHFRLSSDMLGRIRIVPQSDLVPFGPREKCILALDPAIAFSRAVQFPPRNRAELKRMASDLFPFDAADMIYALRKSTKGKIPDSPEMQQIYALRQSDWQAIQKNAPVYPVAVLISDATHEGLAQAIERRLELGNIADMLPIAPAFVPPAFLRAAAMMAVLVVLVFGGMALAQAGKQYYLEKLQAEISGLEQELSETNRRYSSLAHMQSAMQALHEFQSQGEARLMPKLNQILLSMPQGISMDRMEYKDGKLEVSGLFRHEQRAALLSWMQTHGVPAEQLQITPLPQFSRYMANPPWDK